MKRGSSVFVLVALLLVIVMPGILAEGLFKYKVGATIITEPNKDIVIRFLDVTDGKAVKSFPATSDATGIAHVTLETNKEEVNVEVDFVRNLSAFLQTGNVISEVVRGPFYVSDGIEVDLTVDETETNQTTTEAETNTTEVTEPVDETVVETEPEDSAATGWIVVAGKEVLDFTKRTYYYFIGLVVIAGIVFFGMRMRSRMEAPREIKIKKLSEVINSQKVDNKEIEEVEKKLRDAEKELNRLKNGERIKALEEELRKLKDN